MEKLTEKNTSKNITMGSLFDGIGGFPLAAIHNGITPLWASEIEKFPMEVTKIRFPEMEHLGDITKLNGATLPVVDIITGGSPCQDISVAGKRAGLKGERSGLFMEQVRIVREMRECDRTRGYANQYIRPRFMAWENVPGAFSSAAGEDFRAVLEEITKIHQCECSVPRPYQGTWRPAGAIILGDEFSLAWRVLDAQYWGVPQRRNRIFLVADFGGTTAPQILFKQESLQGHHSSLSNSWQRDSNTTEKCTDDTRRIDIDENPVDIANKRQAFHINQREEVIDNHNIAGALMATRTMQMQTFVQEPFYALCDQGGQRMDVYDNKVGTLRASMAGNTPIVLADEKLELFDNHARDCRYNGPLKVSPTIASIIGTGGNNSPLLLNSSEKSYCIAGNIIDREVENGGNGIGCQEDVAYTLTQMDRHAVCAIEPYQNVVGALMHRDYKGVNNTYFDQNKCILDRTYQDVVGALCKGDEKGPGNQYVSQNKCIIDGKNKQLIRRLTPLECERLQGFPDGWTDISKASDSGRYKALGNSVAIPCVDYVMHGIALVLEAESGE